MPDLRRMQLDIETYCEPGFEFSNPQREGDRIVAIALADNRGGEKVISLRDEGEMIHRLVQEIRARDPDVLEGHNLFRFDLLYLEARAARHRVPLSLGRDGSLLRGRDSRLQVAERTLAYRRYDSHGRHVIDTWILAQHWDISARELESFNLKDVARHFGIATPERAYLDPERISWAYRHDRDALVRYALDDVRETRALAGLLAPAYFAQAQILPLGYQQATLRGNATKIDLLLLREYLRKQQAVPTCSPTAEVAGGATAVRQQGVAGPVWHVDVTSLYPSLMLSRGFFPEKDELGVFLQLLTDLRRFRIEAKEAARRAPSEAERVHLNTLQTTFKILINSFYGYLGFPLGHFNDYQVANRITAAGRELVLAVEQELVRRGARVMELDTDGVYFVPPPDAVEGQGDIRLLAELGALLPPGIQLELGGRYRAMFSYKMKNYALLTEDGRLVIRGSSLRSRGIERFQRDFVEEALLLLLTGRREEVPALYKRYLEDFADHRLDVKSFMKTETLRDSLEAYRAKLRAGGRNPSAAYELALASERRYQPGDPVSYYVTGRGPRAVVNEQAKLASEWNPEDPDENVAYYQGKLAELYEKFKPFLYEEEARPTEVQGRLF
jgi:DNA polymerase I